MALLLTGLTPRGRGFIPLPAANKKAPLKGGFIYWWRRRELNPRPSVLCRGIYMFSQVY